MIVATCTDPKTCRTDCLFTGTPCEPRAARVLPEQSPFTWPGRLSQSVNERVALAELGYPTECDGDTLAFIRGRLSRAVEVVR